VFLPFVGVAKAEINFYVCRRSSGRELDGLQLSVAADVELVNGFGATSEQRIWKNKFNT
jgi:hypothetical protein